MRGYFSLAALPALAAGSPLFVDSIHNEAAPVISSVNSKHVPDSYIVVFKDHVSKDAAEAHHLWVQGVHDDRTSERMELRKRSMLPEQESIFAGLRHTYHIPGKLLGYSGHFDEDVIERVRRHPDVSQPQALLSQAASSSTRRKFVSLPYW
jgi:cerevisin